jgi:hypothetical protein
VAPKTFQLLENIIGSKETRRKNVNAEKESQAETKKSLASKNNSRVNKIERVSIGPLKYLLIRCSGAYI